ncbi:hypothetical protein C8_381 [Cannes 8 virus]|nr:hypothetical protein C8_381 [Cannes 8 virus]AIT54937.2 hypothetical protein MEL_323b [Melbournevirus]AVR53079.1 hypothetical protein MarSH_374 [Marseillevirus Shanghai 1]
MFAVWFGSPSKKGIQYEKPNIRQVMTWFRSGGILSFKGIDNCFVSYRGENEQGEILDICERVQPKDFERLKLSPFVSDIREFAAHFPGSYKILLSS